MVKKVTRKKSQVKIKKRTSMKIAKRTYLDAQEHHLQFFSNDGQILKNISEIPKALQNMDAHTFGYHVNPMKNDFANWIEHVFGDVKLAKQVRSVHSRKDIIRAVRRQY
jgi:hypothetical protein